MMPIKMELDRLTQQLREVEKVPSDDERWRVVFETIGYLRESMRSIGMHIYEREELIEMERMSRVTPRGGA